MNKTKNEPGSWTAQLKKNTVHLGYWTVGWVISLVLTAFGPKFFWNFNIWLTIPAVLINILIGFGMIVMNKQYLRGLDEMQRKIFLDASALSLGVGLVFGCSYELLEDIKLITFQPEIFHLILLMTFSFMFGIIMGQRRYR